jgi:hypothetical protein
MGELIMIFIMIQIILKLQENLFTIGLKLRTPKYLISLIILKLKKICGIVNLLIFMDKEQANKSCGFRLIRTKPLVRDDLLEVAMPVVGVVKNRSERKVAQLNDDQMELLKPVMGGKKTRYDFVEENLNLEFNLDRFSSLKDQNKFWLPVPKLMLQNNFRIRDVNFKKFFCLLEKLFLNNLEVIVLFVENLPSKNS